jgi:EmrB/QacA subfamily drug resistance transporter
MEGPVKKTHRPLTLAALLLSMFMSAMEMTVVSTAMPTVVGDLGGIELYAWVFTAYMLAATVTVPIWGKLADLYGRKPILSLGVLLFLAGSATSGLATSLPLLIAFRALQGLGAGAMQPVTLTIVGDIYTFEERGRIQALLSAVWGLAGVAGPYLGGAIVQYLSWHWVFFVNVPAGLLALGLLWSSFHEKVERKDHRLDIAGAGLLAACVISVLAAAQGGSAGWIGSVVAALALVGFLAVERRATEPVVPLSLFRIPLIATSSVTGALLGASMMAMVTYVPLHVQAVLHGTPTQAGAAIAPMIIGWPVASALSGALIRRTGYRLLVRVGLGLSAVAGLLLAMVLGPGVSVWVPAAVTFLFGMGLGLANPPLLIAVQTSVGWQQRGVATASTMFFRTIGGTIAVGVLGAVLAASLSGAGLPPGTADAILGPQHGAGIAAELLARAASALAGGLSVAFWTVSGLAVAAFGTTLLLPRLEAPPAGGAEPQPERAAA